MNALALALALAWGPPDFEDDRLPRSLSESYVQPLAPSGKEERQIYVGLHFGAADGVDGEPSYLAGLEWRMHILPWLGASGSIDFLSKVHATNLPGVDFYQIPFSWAFLFSPPIDLGPFRPYVQGGFGFTVTDVSGSAVFNSVDFNVLGFAGFGLEFELGPNIILDAGVRKVWANDPIGSAGKFNADWKQFTIGVLVTMPR